MRALTLWRPWPWAIFHAPKNPKRIENRPWKPWNSIVGQRIVLHAGQTFDKSAVDDILAITLGRHQLHTLPARASDTGLIGVATVLGWAASPTELGDPAQEQWFSGPFAWLLDDVRAFAEPIPCKGAQGLWQLEPWAERRVAEALR